MKIQLITALAIPAIAASGLMTTQAGAQEGKREGFVPHAGYLRTVQKNRLLRRAKILSGAQGNAALKGTRRLPVIAVEYANVEAPFPAADYTRLLFGNAANSKTLTQYYKDMSRGKLEVTGTVLGWYKLPKDDTYYENGGQGSGRPFGELLQFGLEKADAEIDFGQFDNDGPDGVPNSGDDDGKVDTVVFIHPEDGAETQDTPTNIWSHSWHYSDSSYGHTGPFVTNDVRNDTSGPTGQHIVIEDYVIQPGRTRTEPGQPKHIIEVGVFCHEYGHALGLPDLYDRTPDNGADSQGVGNWCLMAGGSYGGDGGHAHTPAEMCGWCKQFLGWADVIKLEQAGPVDIEPVAIANQMYRIDVPDTDEKEYFLIEYRSREWSDPAHQRITWDEFLTGSGLAVWHIDENVGAHLSSGEVNEAWPFAALNAGQNDAPSLPRPTGANPASWKLAHSLVSLLQADRKLELEKNSGRGDGADLFASGTEWNDDPLLLCGSRSYAGKATGIGISDLNLAHLTMAVSPGLPTVTAPHAAAPGAMLAARLRAPALDAEKRNDLSDLNSKLTKADAATIKVRATGSANSVSPAKDNIEKAFAEVNDRLKTSGSAVDAKNTVEFLRTVSEKDITAAFEPKNRPFVRNIAAQARTRDVTSGSPPATQQEKVIIEQLQKLSPSSAKAVVQLSAKGDKIERVTQLSTPVSAQTIEEDAQARVKELKTALAGDAALEMTPSGVKAKGTVHFQQTFSVNQSTLPVWGAGTTFYYSEDGYRKLNAITSKTVSPETIKVTGTPGKMTIEEAKETAAKQLQVDPKQLQGGVEGIKILQSDPGLARVALRFSLAVGEQQAPLEVFIDSESKQVLAVE